MRVAFSLLIFIIMLCSCSTTNKTAVDKDVNRDTVIYVHDVHTEYVHDTIQFTFPEFIEVNVTRDSVSHLENKYAASDARVIDGILHHDLRTKPQNIDVEFEKPIIKDSTYTGKTKTVTKTITVTKHEPIPLTWWQRFRMDGFWVLLLLLLISYRKYIVAFLRSCFLHK